MGSGRGPHQWVMKTHTHTHSSTLRSRLWASSGAGFSSAEDGWTTPLRAFEKLDREFGFELDAAASDRNALCRDYYTVDDDSLGQDWGDSRVFLNPPYGRTMGKWLKKAHDASRAGATVVCLIPARTDTRWWHDYVMRACEVRLVRGRLKFGGASSSAPFPSAVVVFRPPAGGHGPVFSAVEL